MLVLVSGCVEESDKSNDYKNWENTCNKEEFKNNVFKQLDNFIEIDKSNINITCEKIEYCSDYKFIETPEKCPKYKLVQLKFYLAGGKWAKENVEYEFEVHNNGSNTEVTSIKIQINDLNARIPNWDYNKINQLKELHDSPTAIKIREKINSLTKVNLDETEELIGVNYVALGDMMGGKFVEEIISFETEESWMVVKGLYAEVEPKEPTMIAKGYSDEIHYYNPKYAIRSVFKDKSLRLWIDVGPSERADFYNKEGIMEFLDEVDSCPACKLSCEQDNECNFKDTGDLRGLNYAGHNPCIRGRCHIVSSLIETGEKNLRPPVCGGPDNLLCTKLTCGGGYCNKDFDSKVFSGTCDKLCDTCWGVCEETKESCEFANEIWDNSKKECKEKNKENCEAIRGVWDKIEKECSFPYPH